ncbi:MAG: pyruvate ferredoxin oxidoreductase [bacterium]|nr:pyruvate ferredoxin oxidoreductase [bacterium]
MMQIDPDVVAAYPITPQTNLMQKFADFHADGDVSTELILVESEHSAMSACVGSEAAGARTMTATSANGLALMVEIVYIAASLRLPIVMPVVNRALSGPINIHCDHSDAMLCRDSGWIQLFCVNAQEAYENTIQAMRIAEHPDVLLPVMVNFDGFITSHGLVNVLIHDDKKVKKFVGEYHPQYPLLDPALPLTIGPLDLYDYYFEHKRGQIDAMEAARKVILDVSREFAKEFGSRDDGYFRTYKLENAEMAIVVLNSTGGTVNVVVDQLREQGKKVGAINLRVFRPFPGKELAKALAHVKCVAMMDRAVSFGAMGGPIYNELRSALYELDSRPAVISRIYGLGGRQIETYHIEEVFEDLSRLLGGKSVDDYGYLNVRQHEPATVKA